MRVSGSSASLIKPLSSRIRPSINCGVPSGPISARIRADTGMLGSYCPSPMRIASSRSFNGSRSVSISRWRFLSVRRIVACSIHGRSPASELMVSATLPGRGRFRLRLMSRNVQRLPLRWSSTTRFPFLRPSSLKSRPSRPAAPSPSIQASKAVRSGIMPRALGCGTDANSVIEGADASPARNGGCAADAVTSGWLLVPANTVTRPSGSIRTCISAPTKLNRLARTFPVMMSLPDTPTSALGALATTTPWASRTTMSRTRSAVRPLASRSSCAPPTLTRWWLPKFSSMAAASHGVATSKSIGPLPRRHHSATNPISATQPSTAVAIVHRRHRYHRRIARMRQHVRPSSSGVGSGSGRCTWPRASASRSSMSR